LHLPSRELVELNYKIIFRGGDADDNRIEAYPAAQSLEGLMWALSLTLHFGITGDIRGRGDLSRSAKVYISPPKRGSVLYDLNILVQENAFLSVVVGGYAVNTIAPYLNGLISYTFNQALGEGGDEPSGARRFLKKLNGEKVDKLIKRIEPPLTRAHTAIGKTVETIEFKSKRTELAVLDIHTKAYLEAKLSDDFETVDTNVTSFNLLSGNGRIFDPDTKETAAFSVRSNAHHGTESTIIGSMEQYALGRRGTIRIVLQRVETVEGRLKKFVISSAQEIPHSDWIGGSDPMRSRR
jgi:hypothetical protein